VISVARLARVHPWIRLNGLVYAGDELGLDENGKAVVVDRDGVVTGIAPDPEYILVAWRGVSVRPEMQRAV
jgi:hypothetical protein